MSATTKPSWLTPAVAAVRSADCFFFHAGAGIGVDSGLPDFRSPGGFWKAYPPMAKLGLTFAECSNPRSFLSNPRFGWGFYGHRYQLYSSTVPHSGFQILRKWGESARLGHFVFTSNVDGAFQKAGFSENRILECHGSIHFLQPLDVDQSTSIDTPLIWPADQTLKDLVVNPDSFLCDSVLPTCPPSIGSGLARPNILMFGDWGWVPDRTAAQESRHDSFVSALPRDAKVVVVEVGAGHAVPTVRRRSEGILRAFKKATLIRINNTEPEGPEGTISVREGGKYSLELIEEELAAMATSTVPFTPVRSSSDS